MKKFILGVFFTLIGLPLIDDIVIILAKQTELYSYKILKKIYDIKKTINDDVLLSEEDGKNTIGFQTSCIGYEVENEVEEEQ